MQRAALGRSEGVDPRPQVHRIVERKQIIARLQAVERQQDGEELPVVEHLRGERAEHGCCVNFGTAGQEADSRACHQPGEIGGLIGADARTHVGGAVAEMVRRIRRAFGQQND